MSQPPGDYARAAGGNVLKSTLKLLGAANCCHGEIWNVNTVECAIVTS
jgi:hypothetical protein